jgi:phosphonoacetate hydrolase
MPGIDAVYGKVEGCTRFGLPLDRMGDLIVLSGGASGSKVLGTCASKHDLSGLDAPLRSHGGLSEQVVPIIINRKAQNLPATLRNFDAFFIGCNHV